MANASLLTFGSPHIGWQGVFGVINTGGNLDSTDLGTQYNGIAMTWTATMGDTITDIGFHQGTTTGTPAVGSYSIALFPLTTGGLPNTGATFASAALNSVTVTTFTPSSGNDNTWVWVSLAGNTYTLTQGQEYAIVLWRNAATDASNKITVNPSMNNFYNQGIAASVTCAAGTWSKQTAAHQPTMGVRSSGSAYGFPYTTTAAATVNNFGSTTESGVIFTIPSSFGSTYVLRGIRGLFKTPTSSATNTFQANLYSSPTSSPVQLAKSVLVKNDRFQRNNTFTEVDLYFTSPSTLTCGTQYGIGFSTTSATDGGIYTLNQVAQSDFLAWNGQMQTQFATRTASSFANIDAGTATGNFSGTTTLRPWLDLILDDLTPPAGAAGMLFIPDLAGT